MINTFLLFEQQNLVHKNVRKVSYYSFDMSLSARNQLNTKLGMVSLELILCAHWGGQVPIKWPASRDEVWQANVPHTFLAVKKSDQHWMVVNGDKVNFPGGGTHFPLGADKYIAHLGKVCIDYNISRQVVELKGSE